MIFRYPGGKKKQASEIVSLAASFSPKEYHEVFVGGGSVLCEIAKQIPNIALYANDLDANISSFWKIISKGKIDDLLGLLSVTPTIKLFNKLREQSPKTDIERAYHAVFFNRTTFSGIYSAGPIGGQDQKSKWTINCRYNFKLMEPTIKYMSALFSNRLTVTNLDFRKYLTSHKKGLLYLDPPYFDKGESLYRHYFNEQDHIDLATFLKKKKQWILSYDNCHEIKNLYKFATIDLIKRRYSISGKKINWTDKQEFLISNSPLIAKGAQFGFNI